MRRYIYEFYIFAHTTLFSIHFLAFYYGLSRSFSLCIIPSAAVEWISLSFRCADWIHFICCWWLLVVGFSNFVQTKFFTRICLYIYHRHRNGITHSYNLYIFIYLFAFLSYTSISRPSSNFMGSYLLCQIYDKITYHTHTHIQHQWKRRKHTTKNPYYYNNLFEFCLCCVSLA